jgi:hypothetical protein
MIDDLTAEVDAEPNFGYTKVEPVSRNLRIGTVYDLPTGTKLPISSIGLL